MSREASNPSKPASIGGARATREAALWPEESLENERKTGAYVSRLYPFLRRDGAVDTPRGQGPLLQAFSSGCAVQMLRGWAVGKDGKRHRSVLIFPPEDVRPLRPGVRP